MTLNLADILIFGNYNFLPHAQYIFLAACYEEGKMSLLKQNLGKKVLKRSFRGHSTEHLIVRKSKGDKMKFAYLSEAFLPFVWIFINAALKRRKSVVPLPEEIRKISKDFS